MIRVFIVGCPRSGTTLLQCLLAAHSQMISFPESHLHYDFSKAADRLRQFDELTQQQNLLGWIEKTPRHLHYIADIEALCPDAKFVHCLRTPLPNVAALYAIERRHGTAWSYRPKTIDECFQRWQKDFEISNFYKNRLNHKLIKYEELAENPAEVLNNLCQLLGLVYESAMLKEYVNVAPQVDEQAPWKISVRQPIRNFNSLNLSYLLADELTYLKNLCISLNSAAEDYPLPQ